MIVPKAFPYAVSRLDDALRRRWCAEARESGAKHSSDDTTTMLG